MLKKGVGQRYKALIDELDVLIFLELYKNPQGVLELTRHFGVEHKTIKSHIDKLQKFEAIHIKQLPRNKKLLLLTTEVAKFIMAHKNKIQQVIQELEKGEGK